ncbi:Tctex-1 family protein [Trichomonas vaginalis G3]|uniref:Tctex-1 family protein n=1 Tax=Trichomonas vaginalis (strain ATCC PRA-98 / G3) TaxID=412133 RepID=A2DN03_TRIV3|nr:intracellular protein transport protein [Trichomonas vaginalis G3]EAY18180.1 Tctex-1 family protein [Trichomonas vaginalis G3]KAI5491476.1 intracellular protein transport protein [Trichomonas vaginalis G3]|eukprot:XP_001579166.1 Tctex-1 family protein [Trichomonas vaginalis G3]
MTTQGDQPFQDQSFNSQQVNEIISRVISGVLKSGEFVPDKVQEHLTNILHEVLSQLKELNFRFKYCVSGLITQNCGAGLYQFASTHYEKNQDNFANTVYQKGNIICSVTVYGFKI